MIHYARSQQPFSHTIQHVRIYFVQPDNEIFTQEEQAASIVGIRNAYSFWQTNGYTKTIEIDTTGMLYPKTSPYSTLLTEWYDTPLIEDNPITTIFIVNNKTTQSKLFTSEGYNQEYYNIIVALLYPFGETQTHFESVLAHELGHNLYHLPDLYYTKCSNDIMCRPYYPYQRGFVGCKSLAYIGRPCTLYYVPLIMSR